MSVDRIATSAQTAFFLSQIEKAGAALDQTQAQIASKVNSTTYAGFGTQTQVLTATISANARNSAYATATTAATTQVDMQDTQLTGLSSLAAQLKKAVSDVSSNNDASSLMAQVQSIFDQASAILNTKDANGDYVYSGGKTDTPPLTVNSLSQLAALPSVSGAFDNGDLKKTVQVADGVNVAYGVTASDIGTGLMQALKDVASFDAGPSGNFNSATTLSQAQSDFLTGAIGTATSLSIDLNAATAANGYVSNQLTNAQTQQTSMDTLYKGFVSNIQDTNMADASTQLSLNQVQLQAALQVTAGLHQLSLLNYMSASTTT
jgi:flagellar hook-associated protein 3 FlgL